MDKTTSILRKLHNSNIEFKNTFNVFDEIIKYENLLKEINGKKYDDYDTVRDAVMNLKYELNILGEDLKPCHNDTVPDNFIKGKDNTFYLIDWEYSGSNDPMWDLAAHIIECDFNEDEEELFLSKYFETSNIDLVNLKKILIYKICQDFLWSIWTIVKEAKGDNFGTYGIDRYNRAIKNISKLQNWRTRDE